MPAKNFEDLSFDEMVDLASEQMLHDLLSGTKLRTAVWRACEISARWRQAINDKKPKKKK